MSVEQQLGSARAPSVDVSNNPQITQPSTAFCPRFHHAVEMIGRRWTGAIVRAMLGGATRYTDIAVSIPGLSDRLLSERLRELESEEILTRTVIPAMPVRVEYHLTAKGQSLLPILEAVSAWAEHWIDGPTAAAACDAHERANPEAS